MKNIKNNSEKKELNHYASLWKRIASFFIEIFIIIFLTIILQFFIRSSYLENRISIDYSILGYVFLGFIFINTILYLTKAQSIAYYILGLKIVEKKDESKANIFKLILRFIFKILILISLYILGFIIAFYLLKWEPHAFAVIVILPIIISFIIYLIYFLISLIISPKKQAFYDKWSDLVVINKR